MKVKLEVEFNSFEEAADFLSSKSVPSSAKVSAPAEDKPKREKKKKLSDEELMEMSDSEAEDLTPAQKGKRTKLLKKAAEEAAPAPQVESNAASVMNVEVPPEIPAQSQPEPVLDRDALIQEASGLVNKIKELGVPEQEIMPKLQACYQNAGVAQFCRVSELSDQDLPNVVSQIANLVDSLSAPQSGSFI